MIDITVIKQHDGWEVQNVLANDNTYNDYFIDLNYTVWRIALSEYNNELDIPAVVFVIAKMLMNSEFKSKDSIRLVAQ